MNDERIQDVNSIMHVVFCVQHHSGIIKLDVVKLLASDNNNNKAVHLSEIQKGR